MADTRGAFIGSGKIYLADIETPEKLIFIGNCSALSYEPDVEDMVLPDYTTPGGGTDSSVSRITAMNIAYTAHHFNKANIARALRAKVSDVPGGNAVDEPHTAYHGALVKTKFPKPSAVVVKNQAGDVTYLLDEDYIISDAGIEVLEAGSIPDESQITVSYSYPAHADIQGMTASNRKFRQVFVGLNEARSGKPMIVDVHRISHSPATLGLIGSDYGAMEFSGKAEKDPTKIGTDVSQFLYVQDVD
ncbi:hypothetical protein ACFSB1_10715 [Halopseudomonas phragmitis]|uniref:Uncharacterized protein n=1 Tax=Halopseudomonas phragmitis TaxID=1931241 RepID=A0A1V0B9D6_9GAMM|nr:hypothetical protein [Halopseudomonas phragmitis]AQZ96556.1 hypothetical protein BVH74_18160 [Halopseudomonas phragmitis]